MAEAVLLTCWPPGPLAQKDVLAIIVGLDVDFDVLGLGQHGHGGGRGVDASLGLGLGHALHAMAAAFVLQLAIDPFAFDAEDHFLEAAQFGGVQVEHFDLPAFGFGVVLVHVVQVAGEQRGLVAAGAGADFHHDPRALGVLAADGHVQQLVPDRLALAPQRGQLGLGQLAHLGVLAGDHFLGFGDLLVELLEAAILRGQLGQRAMLARGGGHACRSWPARPDRPVAAPAPRSEPVWIRDLRAVTWS